jgi:hypothetical protein
MLIDSEQPAVIARQEFDGTCSDVVPVIGSDSGLKLLVSLYKVIDRREQSIGLDFDRLVLWDPFADGDGQEHPFGPLADSFAGLGSCTVHPSASEGLILHAKCRARLGEVDPHTRPRFVRPRYYWGMLDSTAGPPAEFIWDAGPLGRWCIASEDAGRFVCTYSTEPDNYETSTVALIDLHKRQVQALLHNVVGSELACHVGQQKALAFRSAGKKILCEIDLTTAQVQKICRVKSDDRLAGFLDESHALIIRGAPVAKEQAVCRIALAGGKTTELLKKPRIIGCHSNQAGQVIVLHTGGIDLLGPNSASMTFKVDK